MKKVIYLLTIFTLFVMSTTMCLAKNKIIRFASLDWPPYTGKSLFKKGANVVVAKAAFAAMGYELEVDFFPWARTIIMAKRSKYLGYFPEYYSKEIEKNFSFSDPIGNSPLGFVERTTNPITWTAIDDLNKIKSIGVVRGYVNTVEFDLKVASGEINVETVVDDATNIRKVLFGRIEMAVIDKSVLQYIINTDSQFKDKKDQLQFNARLLENKKLHVCFQKSKRGKNFTAIFNQGLKKINIDRITEEYFQDIFK